MQGNPAASYRIMIFFFVSTWKSWPNEILKGNTHAQHRLPVVNQLFICSPDWHIPASVPWLLPTGTMNATQQISQEKFLLKVVICKTKFFSPLICH